MATESRPSDVCKTPDCLWAGNACSPAGRSPSWLSHKLSRKIWRLGVSAPAPRGARCLRVCRNLRGRGNGVETRPRLWSLDRAGDHARREEGRTWRARPRSRPSARASAGIRSPAGAGAPGILRGSWEGLGGVSPPRWGRRRQHAKLLLVTAARVCVCVPFHLFI